MFRALVKTGIACAYTWSRAGRHSGAASLPFIVGYHRVVENFAESARRTIPSMLISSATFEKHLDWLARRFQIVSLDEIGRRLENGDTHPVPSRRSPLTTAMPTSITMRFPF